MSHYSFHDESDFSFLLLNFILFNFVGEVARAEQGVDTKGWGNEDQDS